ncbi:hypothetical protein ETH_00032485 [Eimeria tenella]|uniref:Uncharacterized protein n=1 Tax=Eimeria tenella TaxID=5802 RepID=U6L4K1_EIMTE|nr:hypothetical protein ETH_00032485 [Eimeria tenella]CDJ45076.1 hypothetical protein ETH_00032485 [Eimeria tenella]|eukprot:XP_013235823.1 hypothetical protein ETH_00032485 [Eimeria tenella]
MEDASRGLCFVAVAASVCPEVLLFCCSFPPVPQQQLLPPLPQQQQQLFGGVDLWRGSAALKYRLRPPIPGCRATGMAFLNDSSSSSCGSSSSSARPLLLAVRWALPCPATGGPLKGPSEWIAVAVCLYSPTALGGAPCLPVWGPAASASIKGCFLQNQQQLLLLQQQQQQQQLLQPPVSGVYGGTDATAAAAAAAAARDPFLLQQSIKPSLLGSSNGSSLLLQSASGWDLSKSWRGTGAPRGPLEAPLSGVGGFSSIAAKDSISPLQQQQQQQLFRQQQQLLLQPPYGTASSLGYLGLSSSGTSLADKAQQQQQQQQQRWLALHRLGYRQRLQLHEQQEEQLRLLQHRRAQQQLEQQSGVFAPGAAAAAAAADLELFPPHNSATAAMQMGHLWGPPGASSFPFRRRLLPPRRDAPYQLPLLQRSSKAALPAAAVYGRAAQPLWASRGPPPLLHGSRSLGGGPLGAGGPPGPLGLGAPLDYMAVDARDEAAERGGPGLLPMQQDPWPAFSAF